MTEPIVTATDVIAAELMTGFPQGERAQTITANILRALASAGFEVLAPQDIDWGQCPDNAGDGHHVSTNMCVFCLQYDPE
jgi:hypothetical protein